MLSVREVTQRVPPTCIRRTTMSTAALQALVTFAPADTNLFFKCDGSPRGNQTKRPNKYSGGEADNGTMAEKEDDDDEEEEDDEDEVDEVEDEVDEDEVEEMDGKSGTTV
jgi:Ran GTPase-activating protein (RanGAP) involved in mRNA processing and transport